MPKYSIIVVSYNGEKYINKCLGELLKQTYKDYEIIFIDDGSCDNTKEEVKKFKKVKYYKINHSGVSAARNYGIDKSNGMYFLFVDVDDYVDKDMLKVIDDNLKEDVDLVKFGYKIVDENNNIIKNIIDDDRNICDGEEAFKILCNKKNVFDMICIYIYNKNYWIKNKYSFKEGCYHEDFGIIPYALLNAKKVKILSYSPYYYVQTQSSITRSDDDEKSIKKAYDYLKHYDFLYNKVNNNKFNKETKRLFNSYISNSAILKINTIPKYERKKYIGELKKRNVFNNIQDITIMHKIKKMILKISPNLYLKVMK